MSRQTNAAGNRPMTLTRRSLLARSGSALPIAGAAIAGLGATSAAASRSRRPAFAPPSNAVAARLGAVPHVRAQATGTLNWATPWKGRTKDPHGLYALQDMVILGQAMEPLVALNAAGEIVPALAESWSVADDGKTWTFNLRQGVTFHDGTPFTAESVKASVERCKDNVKSGYAFMFQNYDDPPVTIVDDHTVELRTKAPEASLLNNLVVFYLLPPEAGENTDMTYDAMIGTGPFQVVEYDVDRLYRYEANPNYWRPDAPKVQTVNMRPIVEQSSLSAAMLAGEVDLAEGFSPDNMAIFRDNPAYNIHDDLLWRVDFYLLNQASMPALADPLVRRAMAFAIDRAPITESIMLNTAFPWSTYPPQGILGATDAYPANPFDLAQARELMAQSSAPDGFEATIRVPSGFGKGKSGEISQVVAQQLQEIGINLEVELGEPTAMDSTLREGDYSVGYMTSVAVTGDANRFLVERYVNNLYNTGYQNPEVNEIIDQITTTIDPQERLALFEPLHALVWEDMPLLYLFQSQNSIVSAQNVSGFQATGNQVYRVTDVAVAPR